MSLFYSQPGVELHHGDCLAVMRSMESESIDAICTDPPAGINFMNKAFDSDRGGRKQWVAWLTEIMSEALRITKPGGHAFVWALPRTSHWTAWALEDSGWEIRDRVSHLFGSGFPKSKFVLKPAVEDWWLARKPLSESSIARNVLEHGTGCINIDTSRVGVATDEPNRRNNESRGGQGHKYEGVYRGREVGGEIGRGATLQHGRWPANLLLSHVSGPIGCQRIGTKRVKPGNGSGKVGKGRKSSTVNTYGQYGPRPEVVGFTHLDPDGMEEVTSFECVEGCPVALLDLQSGTTKSSRANRGDRDDMRGDNYGRSNGARISDSDSVRGHSDAGGASRFFQQFHEPDTGTGFFYSPKSSRRERNLGLEDMPDVDTRGTYGDGIQDNRPHTREGYEYRTQTKNNHPTVKPLALMRYLVRLVTPPSGTVLDCFCGSGTTGIAAIKEGFNFIGIEAEEEYCQIAAARIAHAGKEEPPNPRPLKIVPKLAGDHIEAQASLFNESGLSPELDEEGVV